MPAALAEPADPADGAGGTGRTGGAKPRSAGSVSCAGRVVGRARTTYRPPAARFSEPSASTEYSESASRTGFLSHQPIRRAGLSEAASVAPCVHTSGVRAAGAGRSADRSAVDTEPSGSVVRVAGRARTARGYVEVQVLQQTGGVRGDHIQPVLRWLPEAARCRRAHVRRPAYRALPGRAGRIDPPGEALHRPGRRA
ncbi:hypothetical protein [Micromonospora sp. 067-2]|uniref:hypothetical protein n=1 Tax=Micromonospora sp. 067-2 TaxID=2789270 RepID=UPI00397B4B0B